jgi:hypothetical protein
VTFITLTRKESVVNTVFVVPSADHLSSEVAPN